MQVAPQSIDETIALLQILQFQMDIGVDEWIEENAFNRLEAPIQEAPAVPTTQPSPAKENPITNQQALLQSAPNMGSHEAIQLALSIAENCSDLSALQEAIKGFDTIDIANTATQGLLGLFSDQQSPKSTFGAKLLFIFDCPDRDEDRTKTPLNGTNGTMFKEMMLAIGFALEDINITYAVHWRPPGERSPNANELEICKAFLQRAIVLTQPNFIILMGKIAANAVLGSVGNNNHASLNGKWHGLPDDFPTMQAKPSKLFSCYAPKYLGTAPKDKAQAWQSLLDLKKNLINIS